LAIWLTILVHGLFVLNKSNVVLSNNVVCPEGHGTSP